MRSNLKANPENPYRGPLLSLLLISVVLAALDGCVRRPRRSELVFNSPYKDAYTVLIKRTDSYEEACVVSERLRAVRINNAIEQCNDKWLVVVGRFVSEELAAARAKDLNERGTKQHRTLGLKDAKVLRPGKGCVSIVFVDEPDAGFVIRPSAPLVFFALLILVMAVLALSTAGKPKGK
ncbi:MAG: hypothetical protein ONA90_04370 [candidate division KSB1 bacterium]|nr:hypothetical protein [candidate division KSB1 bacterium]